MPPLPPSSRFLLFSFYSAVLTSTMTARSPPPKLESYEDLANVYYDQYELVVWKGTDEKATSYLSYFHIQVQSPVSKNRKTYGQLSNIIAVRRSLLLDPNAVKRSCSPVSSKSNHVLETGLRRPIMYCLMRARICYFVLSGTTSEGLFDGVASDSAFGKIKDEQS